MFSTSSLIKVNNSLCHLLEIIDLAIYTIAGDELDNIRYGLDSHTNYDIVDSLEDYREIILMKILGCNCISVSTDILASRIKKLTKSTC